jgi:hypothetical protein
MLRDVAPDAVQLRVALWPAVMAGGSAEKLWIAGD